MMELFLYCLMTACKFTYCDCSLWAITTLTTHTPPLIFNLVHNFLEEFLLSLLHEVFISEKAWKTLNKWQLQG
jgi:hypothetical protein